MRRTVAVVTAGLRQPSSTRLLADRLAEATRRELERLGAEVEIETIEVRDHGHDLVNNHIVGYPSEELERVLGKVARADGLIAVTPTFTTSYNGLFKMFVDVLDDTALIGKPVLIAATGGTARHSLVLDHGLRPLFSYLRATVVPTGVFAGPEDWGATGSTGAAGTTGSAGAAEAPLARRVERAAAELAREVDRRDPPAPDDPFESPVPFGGLLPP
ncbi:FMN reductase [Streptosporangium sp. NPDC048865]|uniref:FMN reductase n=1 Tax=Streptosporangium sp. NPDC048865 TaxID=3155766 RepID=UPI0034409854